LEWNNLNSIKSIQYLDSDFFGVKNEINNLYPFMQAATVDGMNLETVYRLAMDDPKSISESSFYSSFETVEPRRKKRARNIV